PLDWPPWDPASQRGLPLRLDDFNVGRNWNPISRKLSLSRRQSPLCVLFRWIAGLTPSFSYQIAFPCSISVLQLIWKKATICVEHKRRKTIAESFGEEEL
ncbi:unnamed protein product, partial [Musa textilis]